MRYKSADEIGWQCIPFDDNAIVDIGHLMLTPYRIVPSSIFI